MCVRNYTGESLAFPMEVIENGKLIGSINGTVVGSATLVTGKKGLALHTNGIDQYIDFGYQGDACLGYFILCTHGWVVAFWIQLQFDSDRYGSILDTGQGANRGVKIYKRKKGQVAVAFKTVDRSCFLRSTPSNVQGWIHVVVTWCPSFCKLFFDGGLAAKRAFASITPVTVTRTPRFVIGARDDYRVLFNGTLDELRVWDSVMSDEEVMAMYRVDATSN